MSPASSAVRIARSATGSGLVAFEHDPDATRTAIVSPSTVRIGALVGLWAGAAALVALVLLLPLRTVAGRVQPSPVQADAADARDPSSDPTPAIEPESDAPPGYRR